jgi:hypothetical protein
MPNAAQGCATCTFTLPSGRRCAAVALHGRAFCRHHVAGRRRILQDAVETRLARYRRELDAMDLPRLLEALLEKLGLISAIIPGYPEATLIVGHTAQRLATLLSNCFEEESSPVALERDLAAILNYEELEKFADNRAQEASAPQTASSTPAQQQKKIIKFEIKPRLYN